MTRTLMILMRFEVIWLELFMIGSETDTEVHVRCADHLTLLMASYLKHKHRI